MKQQLRTADTVDVRRILSTADKPINEANILATAGLWDYKLTLNIPRVQHILATLPKEVCFYTTYYYRYSLYM